MVRLTKTKVLSLDSAPQPELTRSVLTEINANYSNSDPLTNFQFKVHVSYKRGDLEIKKTKVVCYLYLPNIITILRHLIKNHDAIKF